MKKKSNTYNNTVTSKNKRHFAQYLWDYLEKNIVIQGQTTIHEVSSQYFFGKKSSEAIDSLPQWKLRHCNDVGHFP
jgi:hypothetical protein